jgi:acyl phosphate:glycerol-3-phosphate acyltransferase
MTAFLLALAAVVGYLFGAIPFGVLISRMFADRDVRQVGSGKIGMTNVMRAAGKKAAVVSLLLDMGKAAAAVLVAGAIFSSHTAVVGGAAGWSDGARALAALAAISGHSWSVFLKFKGGRGVATFIGGLLALYWPAAVVGGGLMLVVGFTTRYMSMGSIVGAVAAFIVTMALTILEIDLIRPYPPIETVIYTMICAIFIYVMHRDNIIRLVSGTERKIGEKGKAGVSASSGNVK